MKTNSKLRYEARHVSGTAGKDYVFKILDNLRSENYHRRVASRLRVRRVMIFQIVYIPFFRTNVVP